MTVFLMVPGAWMGGWVWRDLTPRIRAAGLDVYTPTLTGLGERRHLASRWVNLDTHVEDVVNVMEFEELADVALVGHSYGGMVITAVAHHAPERLSHLVYLDAIVPDDGEAAFSDDSDEFRAVVEQQARERGDGWLWPLPDAAELRQFLSLAGIGEGQQHWLRHKSVPHPVATLAQPVRLGNPAAEPIPRTYIRCTAGEWDSELPRYVELARTSPDWRYHELATGHWPMISTPRELAHLLIGLV